jgi:UDP-2-acetamido-2-deoxy-ribo-hexuluronate aminotransferase
MCKWHRCLANRFNGSRVTPGDEVIVPAFTYVATAEVIALLHLVPVMVDVMPDDFSINLEQVRNAISSKTKAIVPVHLFGQCARMEELLNIDKEHNIFVVEDAAQAIGAKYIFNDGSIRQAGTMGHIATTSFSLQKTLDVLVMVGQSLRIMMH